MLNTQLSPLYRTFRIVIWISLSLVFAISFIDLYFQVFDSSFFSGLKALREPMNLITASCFAVSALTLVILNSEFAQSIKRILSVFFVLLIFGISIFYIYVFLNNLMTGHKSILSQINSLRFLLFPGKFMPFLTSCNFLFIGFILFLLISNEEELSNIAHILTIPVFLISYFIIVRRIFEVYSVTELKQAPTSPDTGIAFCGLIAVILLMRPGTWRMKLLTSTTTAGTISRKLLPPLIILPVVIGWLRIHGERNGIIKSEEGVVIVAVAFTFCSLLLIWLTARYIERTDIKRRSVEKALRESEERFKAILFQITK